LEFVPFGCPYITGLYCDYTHFSPRSSALRIFSSSGTRQLGWFSTSDEQRNKEMDYKTRKKEKENVY
jgi:hypothetical protein